MWEVIDGIIHHISSKYERWTLKVEYKATIWISESWCSFYIWQARAHVWWQHTYWYLFWWKVAVAASGDDKTSQHQLLCLFLLNYEVVLGLSVRRSLPTSTFNFYARLFMTKVNSQASGRMLSCTSLLHHTDLMPLDKDHNVQAKALQHIGVSWSECPSFPYPSYFHVKQASNWRRNSGH